MSRPVEWVPIGVTAPAVKRRGAHAFTAKICKWLYCARCGLILLRNVATQQAERRQCEWEE